MTAPLLFGRIALMWWINIVLSLIWLMLGACLASFWAVVVYRQAQGQDWKRGRSKCEHCQTLIAWYDNIPIWSYLRLKGKCRHCQQKIASFYWWWEMSLGVWTVVWWWYWCPWSRWWQTSLRLDGGWVDVSGWETLLAGCWWCLGAILVWTALVDIQTHELATGWLLVIAVLTLLGLIASLASGQLLLSNICVRAIESVVIGSVFWLIDASCRRLWHKPGIGSGDTYLVMLLAWWLAPLQLLMMFLLAFWLGAVIGVVILALKKDKSNTTLAFLPFINGAFLLAYVYGQQIFAWIFGVR